MTALTRGAARALAVRRDAPLGVAGRRELDLIGITDSDIAAQVAAQRWRIIGTAIVLHNGSLTQEQRCRVATINCGPRSVLTSFTAVAQWGLRGWARPEIHVLAPGGTTRPRLPGLILHRTRDWDRADLAFGRRLHMLGPSLVLAAQDIGQGCSRTQRDRSPTALQATRAPLAYTSRCCCATRVWWCVTRSSWWWISSVAPFARDLHGIATR